MLREIVRCTLATVTLLSCSTSTTTQAGSSEDQGGGAGEAAAGRTGLASGGRDAAGGAASLGGAIAAAGSEFGRGGASTEGGATGSPSVGGATSTVQLTCSSYCAAVQANCSSDAFKQYKSDASCMNSCAAFRLGTSNDSAGNTLGCRARSAVLAATDPSANCSAAGPSGGGRCGTSCDGYCSLMSTVCPSGFEDESLCRSECVKMAGVNLTTYQAGGAGDNLQCRIYHATFAAEGFPEIHCTHASPVPAAPCAS